MRSKPCNALWKEGTEESRGSKRFNSLTAMLYGKQVSEASGQWNFSRQRCHEAINFRD